MDEPRQLATRRAPGTGSATGMRLASVRECHVFQGQFLCDELAPRRRHGRLHPTGRAQFNLAQVTDATASSAIRRPEARRKLRVTGSPSQAKVLCGRE